MAKKQRKQYKLNGFNNLNGKDGEGIFSILAGMLRKFSRGLLREIIGIFLLFSRVTICPSHFILSDFVISAQPSGSSMDIASKNSSTSSSPPPAGLI